MTKKILIVDDSPSVRRMVSMALRSAGYEVIEAEDGQRALAQAATHRPNAVLTDQNMPNLDGIGFARAFRGRPESAGVPIVFLSTESEDTIKAKAREAGAIGWMKKPFDEAKLLSVMQKVVGR